MRAVVFYHPQEPLSVEEIDLLESQRKGAGDTDHLRLTEAARRR